MSYLWKCVKSKLSVLMKRRNQTNMQPKLPVKAVLEEEDDEEDSSGVWDVEDPRYRALMAALSLMNAIGGVYKTPQLPADPKAYLVVGQFNGRHDLVRIGPDDIYEQKYQPFED